MISQNYSNTKTCR